MLTVTCNGIIFYIEKTNKSFKFSYNKYVSEIKCKSSSR